MHFDLPRLLDLLEADTRQRKLRDVARDSGVPYYTLRNLRSRNTNPRYDTFEKLRTYYSGRR